MSEILFTTDIKEAKKAVADGYLAIEGAYGTEILVNDEKEPFDHHGRYFNLPSATKQVIQSTKHVKKCRFR